MYSEDRGYLVYNLSAWYQDVLCLVMELAYHTALLNPSLGRKELLVRQEALRQLDSRHREEAMPLYLVCNKHAAS